MKSSATRLAAITKNLWLQWHQTKDYWHDAKTQEFEQKYMHELFATVDKSIAAIEKLDSLITKIKKDCE